MNARKHELQLSQHNRTVLMYSLTVDSYCGNMFVPLSKASTGMGAEDG